MADVDPGTAEHTAAEADADRPAVSRETATAPVPFPDRDVDAVATVVGALAALATGDVQLRAPALEALTPDVSTAGADKGRVDPDWVETVADTVTWLLAVHGVDADSLWQGYYALMERTTKREGQ